MHALAARKGGREVVETIDLHPAERPGVQQFAWEVGGGLEARARHLAVLHQDLMIW